MSGGEEQNPDAIGTLPEGTRGSATRRKPGSLRSVAGKYQLGDVIGRGAHTIVYAATHPHLDQAVAVKISMTVDGSTLARMEREARMLARIDHPTVIKVFGIGWTDDGAPFLAMERVHGQSLREVLLQRGSLPRKEAVDVACQALEALAVVHAEGFVHRDIKPANLMLLEADRHGHRALKLIDFGVGLDERSSRITGPTDIVGTPAYLAPEQLTPHVPVDRRTDLYALGATLFRMLTGELPFAGRGAQLLQQVMFEEAPPVSRVSDGLGRALDRVIAKALHKSPERRYQTAEEMKVAVVNCPLPLDGSRRSGLATSEVGPRVLGSAAASGVCRTYPAVSKSKRTARREVTQRTRKTAQPKATKAKGVRRSPAELQKLRGELVAYIAAHPGESMEKMASALSLTSGELNRPIKKLIESGKVRREGKRRASRYFAASETAKRRH